MILENLETTAILVKCVCPTAQKPRFHAGLRECRYEHSDQKSQKIGR